MGIFSRDDGEVLDLPELHRKGLLKLPQPGPEHDIIDLVKSPTPSVTIPITPPFSAPSGPSSMSGVSDFLSDFASIGVSTAPEIESKKEIALGKTEGDLTWRVENTEYKLEQILNRIAQLEKKFHRDL